MKVQKAINSKKICKIPLDYTLQKELIVNQNYTGVLKKYGMMTMMRYSLGMLVVFLFIMILTSNVYALRLNEIESNPEGKDQGAEWVELYSEDHVSLDGYYLENGDGEIIDETSSFSDNKVEKTYGFCKDSWEFIESTKNEENPCGGQEENMENEEIPKSINNEDKNSELKINEEITENLQNISYNPPKKISLGSNIDQEIEDFEVTKTYKTRLGVIYFFVGFSILLVVLIALKKL